MSSVCPSPFAPKRRTFSVQVSFSVRNRKLSSRPSSNRARSSYSVSGSSPNREATQRVSSFSLFPFSVSCAGAGSEYRPSASSSTVALRAETNSTFSSVTGTPGPSTRITGTGSAGASADTSSVSRFRRFPVSSAMIHRGSSLIFARFSRVTYSRKRSATAR